MISDESRRLTLSERTAVFLVEGNDLVLSVFSGKDSREFLGYRLPIDKSLVGQSLITGKPVTINNAQNNPDVYDDLVVKANVKSFLSVPLRAGSKLIGTITVVDKISGEFNADDERILSMLGSIAVIGLENARMYEDEKRRHIEDEKQRHVAEGLRDILAILNSNRPLSDILDFIIKQAASLMGTTSGSLYRFIKDENILSLDASCGLPEDFYCTHWSLMESA
jgi:GAF domain-containing protein